MDVVETRHPREIRPAARAGLFLAQSLEAAMTPRRKRFVREYVRDLNAKEAAIRAGYARANAKQAGSYLLRQPEVAAAIEALLAAEEQRLTVNADRIVRELMRVAFSDIRRYADWQDGALVLKPLDKLSDDETAAIASISFGGKTRGPRIRLHDKKRALRALGRHIGLFTQRAYVDPVALHAETARIRALLCAAAGIEEPKPLPAADGETA
jgi:phage terminase small subunit